jgi:hypothetical protein
MAVIVELFRNEAYEPEALKALCAAYDIATAALHDRNRRPDIVNEVIAQRIVTLAKTGERDPHALANGALIAMGFGGLE